MIALDTNVLVRLITEDDPIQARGIEAFLENTEGPYFIPDIVLAELAWVLQRRYAFARPEVGHILHDLLNRRDVVFEDEERARAAVRGFAEGLDLADALIMGIARSAGCDRLASFDDALKAKAPGFIVRPES
ncbi:MAG: type II toxin-antitoxin system VapC family toxin [Candidatus Aminicenantales bacterium]